MISITVPLNQLLSCLPFNDKTAIKIMKGSRTKERTNLCFRRKEHGSTKFDWIPMIEEKDLSSKCMNLSYYERNENIIIAKSPFLFII